MRHLRCMIFKYDFRLVDLMELREVGVRRFYEVEEMIEGDSYADDVSGPGNFVCYTGFTRESKPLEVTLKEITNKDDDVWLEIYDVRKPTVEQIINNFCRHYRFKKPFRIYIAMEARDFFEDDEMTTFKSEYNGKGRRKFLDWVREQCRGREMYQSPNEYDENGWINLNYVATDEELWAKWKARESGKSVFFLKGQFRRIMELRMAKMRAEKQAQNQINQSSSPTSGTSTPASTTPGLT